MSNENIGYVGTGTMDLKSATPYQHSFGPLVNETAYINGWKGIDVRPQFKTAIDEGMQRIQQKAMTTTTGGAGTAGYALIPVYVDPRIVDLTRKETPLVELIPRVTNQGLTADYNQLTAKGGGFVAAEDAALSETNDTYDRASTAIKYLYAVGRVTGQARAGQPSYILEGLQSSGSGLGVNPFTDVASANAMQTEVLVKAQSLRELEESLIVTGDASTTATEYSGIQVLLSGVNQTNKSTTALEYADIETAAQNAFDDGGRPSLAVCASSVLVDIRKLMIDTFRYGPSDLAAGGNLPFGVSARLVLDTMVGTIPVIPSRYLSNTTGSKEIYFLDMRVIEMRVLQDMTYEEMAKVNDSQKFFLKIYECLIIKATQFNSSIIGIA